MISSYNGGLLAATLAMLLNGAPAAAAQDQGARATCVASAPAALSGIVPAETPAFFSRTGVTGSAEVQISLSPTGELENAAIAKSSGNEQLDQAAIKAARQQKYSPEVNNCQAVSGIYLLGVDFNEAGSNS